MRQRGKQTYSAPSRKLSSDGQKGLPLYGGPKGFGLKQLDGWGDNKVCSGEQRWNWKKNVDGGFEVIESKVGEMKSSPHLRTIKSQIVGKENDLTMDDIPIGNVTFTLANSSYFSDWDVKKAITENKKSFLDANLITLYNGKGHVIDDIKTEKNEVRNETTGQMETIVHYRIVIDTNKLDYLNAVFK